MKRVKAVARKAFFVRLGVVAKILRPPTIAIRTNGWIDIWAKSVNMCSLVVLQDIVLFHTILQEIARLIPN